MANSCISGALPQWKWNFAPLLWYLNLSNNMLTGDIPVPVANTYLASIDLSSNKLVGNLPRLANNSGLRLFDLSNNKLSGDILLNNVSVLEKLDLSMNNFRGTVPRSLCNAKKLAALYLSNNQLSGPLPNCMCASTPDNDPDTGIIDIRLNKNHLNGSLPPSFQNCSRLVNLDLGENSLSGAIPDWIARNMVKLRIFRLASNRFHGSIPLNLWNLRGLRIVDLSTNNLSGSIPSSLGNLAAMKAKPDAAYDEYGHSSRYIYADKPLILQIKDALLSYTSQLKHVRDIDLSGNHLCGQIPPQLGNLIGLQGLNLSNNLSGNIPSSLGDLLQLESLDLSTNKLSGVIPRALGDLSSMGTFNVSYNNLSGPIPRGGHLLTFQDTSYIGNPELCGSPLPKPCASSSPQNPDAAPPNDGNHDMFWFPLGLAPGFVFGFWIFWGPLLLVTRWRYAYFRFLDGVSDKYLRHYFSIF